MPVNGVRLTGPARREKAQEAYQLAIRRETFTEISSTLDISRNLVSTLVKEEQERQWADRDTSEIDAEKQRAIVTYEEVIRGAWERLGKLNDSSLNVSGLFNAIISAQSKIDEITGVRIALANDSKRLEMEESAYGEFKDRIRAKLGSADELDERRRARVAVGGLNG